MTPYEWISDVTGKPYRDRADGPDEFDCFGLAMDFVRRVLGAECDLSGYHTGVSFASLLSVADDWHEDPDGFVLCAFNDAGEPLHIGVRLSGRVIHAMGRDGTGQVYNHGGRQFLKMFPDCRSYSYVR